MSSRRKRPTAVDLANQRIRQAVRGQAAPPCQADDESSKGRVINHSAQEIWVIHSIKKPGSTIPCAHRLLPGQGSPPDIDADGFSNDPTVGWTKIRGITVAVSGTGPVLNYFPHIPGLTYNVEPGEFGHPIKWYQGTNWGVPCPPEDLPDPGPAPRPGRRAAGNAPEAAEPEATPASTGGAGGKLATLLAICAAFSVPLVKYLSNNPVGQNQQASVSAPDGQGGTGSGNFYSSNEVRADVEPPEPVYSGRPQAPVRWWAVRTDRQWNTDRGCWEFTSQPRWYFNTEKPFPSGAAGRRQQLQARFLVIGKHYDLQFQNCPVIEFKGPFNTEEDARAAVFGPHTGGRKYPGDSKVFGADGLDAP